VYKFNDKQRRRLLEDALVADLLEVHSGQPGARPVKARAGRPAPATPVPGLMGNAST